MECEELQYGGRSPECVGMSLDVKLAFNRVCSLIDNLKVDIGKEAANNQMLRICNDVAKVLKRRRVKDWIKENELEVTSTSRLKGSHTQLPVTDLHKSVQLGTIVEEQMFDVDVGTESCDASEIQDEEDSKIENSYFLLKSWSVLRKDNDLLLTGIKMNEKGEVLEKQFVSQKLICRKDKDTVKTADGEFVLQGLLVDPKKLIPTEVKNHFSEETVFPRCWRVVVQLWIEIDKQNQVKKKSLSAKKKKSMENSNIDQDKRKSPAINKLEDSIIKKTETSKKDRSLNVTQQRKGKSPAAKQLKENEFSQKIQNNKVSKRQGKSPATNDSIRKKLETLEKEKYKKIINKNQSNNNSTKKINNSENLDTNKKTKKIKEENKPAQKKNKRPGVVSHAKSKDENKKQSECDEGQDDHGPFSELLADESLFILPKSSVTPNGLLGSIKKNVIKGRYTPPTTMFDNVYGNKSDNNSSINTSFDEIGVLKSNPVVKRMCKVNTKTNSRKNNKNQKHVDTEDEAINEVLRAAKTKTNTTPSIMKQVFGDEETGSVNLSDFSDPEITHKSH